MTNKSIYDITGKTLKEVSITEDKDRRILHVIFEAEGMSKDKIGLHAEVREIRESVNGKMIYE